MKRIEVVPFNNIANAKILISDTVVNLSNYLIDAEEEQLITCNIWTVGVTGANVSFFDNGGIPTSSLGFVLTAGSMYEIESYSDLMNFIRATGSDAYITISGYKK